MFNSRCHAFPEAAFMSPVSFNEVVLAMTLMGVACGYFGFILGRYLRSSGEPEKSADRQSASPT